MTARTDRFMITAVKTAKRAKKWAVAAAREADRLLTVARKRADTEIHRRKLKQALHRTGRVLRVAGEAALVAGVTAGIAAVRAESRTRELPKGRRR
ncbi:MAG: hypothetical protein ACHQXA_02000 [Gemmatimonadales bacterium]